MAGSPLGAVSPILTIAAGLFVLGFFLIVNANVRRLTARWAESAEFAVFLRDDATPAQVEAVPVAHRPERPGGLAAVRDRRNEAAERFAGDFPELAGTTPAGSSAIRFRHRSTFA